MASLSTECRQDPIGQIFQDRKSTRLNSSHLVISYAVFCLKKKKIMCLDRATGTPALLATHLGTGPPLPSPAPPRQAQHACQCLYPIHPHKHTIILIHYSRI